MRFEKLDLNLLVALDALLSERNITRAAEKVHLSQSAMSNALGRLRDFFGDPLLVQVQRHMELTPRAQALHDPVRDVLVRIRLTIAAAPTFDPARSDRSLRIFASDYTVHTLMPRVMAAAAAQNSLVQLRFLALLGTPTRALEHGDADLLVIPSIYASQDHPSALLMHEEFVCVVWSGSEHAKVGLDIERYRLARHVLMVPMDQAAPAYEGRFMEQSGMERKVAITTYTFSSVPLLLVGTPYVATVHRRLAERLAAHHALTVLPCPVPVPPMHLMMQWHQVRSSDPAIQWLCNLLTQSAAEG